MNASSNSLFIYNTLSRKKEKFEALHAPFVGLYVCGPTVYGDPHLGHSRPAITFDILFRYLKYLGYKVRYVRNITDVGHLENDEDQGDDKIGKKARLDQLEPMEVAQYYTNRYHFFINKLNVQDPSIEPHASGHILEQQHLVQEILDNGFAYESQGSVYFDVPKYNTQHPYGILSGRNVEDMQANTRSLAGQDEKRSPLDFALWKKASPEHIMRWPSKWSDGFPGWHLECSVMSRKYLGAEFDIHGGGMDLQFPHHECEIAQNTASKGHSAVRYWMHNNMITINGQKMGKSLGNFITLEQMFSGDHPLLAQAYNPSTIRFFILQAHYRSTLDFSNEALQAAEKGFKRLMAAWTTLKKIVPAAQSSDEVKVAEISQRCFDAIADDLNTPILISELFDAVRVVNSLADGKMQIAASDLETLRKLFADLIFEVLGLEETANDSSQNEIVEPLMDLVIALRAQAKTNKDWPTADLIRQQLTQMGIVLKDTKEGSEWTIEK